MEICQTAIPEKWHAVTKKQEDNHEDEDHKEMRVALVLAINKKLQARNLVKKNITYHERGVALIKPADSTKVAHLEFKVTSAIPAIILKFPQQLHDFWRSNSLVSDTLIRNLADQKSEIVKPGANLVNDKFKRGATGSMNLSSNTHDLLGKK